MIAVSEGRVVLPLRSVMVMPGELGMLGNMPGYLADPECFGVKLVSLMPRNKPPQYSSHLGLVLLFEAEHGCPVALLDAAEITAIRTAAASGLATRLLARPDAGDLALLGAGEQARSHLEAMLARARAAADSRLGAGSRPRRAASPRAEGRAARSRHRDRGHRARGRGRRRHHLHPHQGARAHSLGEWIAPGRSSERRRLEHRGGGGDRYPGGGANRVSSSIAANSTVHEGGEYLRALQARRHHAATHSRGDRRGGERLEGGPARGRAT